MAKVWKVRFKGETYYFPGEECKSPQAAADLVGCEAGHNCFVNTVFTPTGVSAKEWIAKQTATEPTTPTPAEPTPTAPTPKPTPTPTTPTPTTPTTPTPAAPSPTASATPEVSVAQTVKERLDQQVAAHNEKTGESLTVEEYLDQLKGINNRTRDILMQRYEEALRELEDKPTTTAEQEADYRNYLDYLKTPAGSRLPVPKNFEDFLAHAEEWYALKREQDREFETYKKYASKFGVPDDWYAIDKQDFYANYDRAQEQLGAWELLYEEDKARELEEEEYSLTPKEKFDRSEEYYAAWALAQEYALPPSEAARRREERYAREREVIEYGLTPEESARRREERYTREREEIEYGLTPEEAARRREERYAREREIIEHALEPEEAARRREESYEEARIAAGERYKETPEYGGAFAQWKERQQDFSGALSSFIESKYPSLQSRFKAEVGPLIGSATPEEARAEAARRQQAFQAWLPRQISGVEEEYYAQRPAQRGERYFMQAPVTRQMW